MDLSVVLPTYNERENIEVLVPELVALFRRNKIDGEVIVVDDTSPDGTYEVAKAFSKKYGNVRVIVRPKKEGMGAALREGYDNARGDIIFSMDSDLAFDNEDILKALEKLKYCDLVVGSRHTASGGYEIRKFKTVFKWLISKTGNFLLRILSDVKVHDFSLNFRGIKKEVWKTFRTNSNTNSFMFETILLAKYNGFKISEIPVTFRDRIYGESKLRLGRETPSFFLKAMKWSILARMKRL